MVRQVIEGTILLVIVYLVVVNAGGFSTAIRSIGSVYSSSVKTLQGR